MDIYQVALRPLLFNLIKADPENLHSKTIRTLQWLGNNSDTQPASLIKSRLQQSLCLQDSRLSQSLFGLQFPNPVGLAAGFDKDGVATSMWSSLGFGFAEIGTVTSLAQPGNPRPRLFRLPNDEAALNRMGFNNCGAAAMERLLAKRNSKPNPVIPIGINLGKSKVTPLEEAANDYRHSFSLLKNYGDYFVVNVSSPNTPGLRKLQDAAMLASILDALHAENFSQESTQKTIQKPIFVKIAPDLEWEAITEIVSLAQSYKLAGIIATNTTIKREGLNTKTLAQTGKSLSEEAGGISGKPVRQRSTEVIKYIWQQSQGKIPIIGVGGIFTAEDAWDKITAGASLVQIYTGWVYQGPGIIRQILKGLLSKLEQNGLNSISEAVGLAVKDS